MRYELKVIAQTLKLLDSQCVSTSILQCLDILPSKVCVETIKETGELTITPTIIFPVVRIRSYNAVSIIFLSINMFLYKVSSFTAIFIYPSRLFEVTFQYKIISLDKDHAK